MNRQMIQIKRWLYILAVGVMLSPVGVEAQSSMLPLQKQLEYRQDITPGASMMYAPEYLARLKDGDKVMLVVHGEGWRDFEKPRTIKIKAGDKGGYRTVVHAGFGEVTESEFRIMKNGDWLGFVHTPKGTNKKFALMANGDVVNVTKDIIDPSNSASLFARDELWWGLYAYPSVHGADMIVTKLASKGTTGFLRVDDARPTTAMFVSYPAAFQEGAMVNIVEMGEKDGAMEFFIPGSDKFSFNPRMHSYLYPSFSKEWELGTKGNGYVTFKAKADSDIRVYFSAIINNDPENSLYCCSIGEKNNSFSAFREKANSIRRSDPTLSDPASFEVDKGQDPSVVIQNTKKYMPYWFKVENGELSWGTGEVVGQETKMVWKDPSPLNDVKYVAFGGVSDVVEFSDIKMSPPVVEKPKVNLPDGFAAYAQAGAVDSLAVGSNNGELSVWAIQKDNLVYWDKGTKRFTAYTGSGLPANAKVSDVSAGGDGAVYVVADDVLYYLDEGTWKPVSTDIWSTENGAIVQDVKLQAKSVAVGNVDNVWALQKDSTKLYQLMTLQDGDQSKIVWIERSAFAVKISAGLDNSAAAIDNQGFVYLYLSGQWVNISAGQEFHKVAVVTKDHIMAIGRDMNLYEYRSATGSDGVYVPGAWTPVLGTDKKPATGLHKISINAAGTTFATDAGGILYSKGDVGVSQAIVDSLAKSVAPIIAPEAEAEIAPGETPDNFLTQLEAAASQLATVGSLLSEEQLARIKEIGQILIDFVPEAKSAAEQIAEEQAAQDNPDVPPTKEEQEEELRKEKELEQELKQVAVEPEVVTPGRPGMPTLGGRPSRVSGAVRTTASGTGMTRQGRSQTRTITRSVRGQTPPAVDIIDAAQDAGVDPIVAVQSGGGRVLGGRGRPTRPGTSSAGARPTRPSSSGVRPGTSSGGVRPTRPSSSGVRPGTSSGGVRPTRPSSGGVRPGTSSGGVRPTRPSSGGVRPGTSSGGVRPTRPSSGGVRPGTSSGGVRPTRPSSSGVRPGTSSGGVRPTRPSSGGLRPGSGSMPTKTELRMGSTGGGLPRSSSSSSSRSSSTVSRSTRSVSRSRG